MECFTRRETLVLTRMSASQLAYLTKTGIVTPNRVQRAGITRLLYTWEQVLELRAIQHLRRQTSLQTIRKVVDFLARNGGDRTLHNKELIIHPTGDIDWVRPDPAAPSHHIVQVACRANRHVGQIRLVALPPFSELVNEVWAVAQRSKVIDFDHFKQRARPQ